MAWGDRRRSDVAGRLQGRLAALGQIGELGADLLPAELLARLAELRTRSTERLGHGSEFTVVALAGSTGSGKSSTFNAVAGHEVAQVGVRRPTTSAAQAVVFTATGSADPATDLLDWLQVPQRQVLVDPDLAGLVLLDLPDHDSVAAANRAEVDRLAKVVDVFCWVVDPQKYADAALHQGYLRGLAHHAAVTVVVLNQIDRVPAEHRAATVADLQRLLSADGMDGVRVLPASAVTGEGQDALRRELAARVAERRALVARIDADIDWTADQLTGAITGADPAKVPEDARAALGRAFASAAGAARVGEAVAAHHRYRSRQVAGWPVTRWAGRLKPDPLRRLGLTRRQPSVDGAVAGSVPRTSLGRPTAMAAAEVDAAIRGVVEPAGHGLPAAWQARLSAVARARRDDVEDALDRAVGSTPLPSSQPRWWRIAGLVQWAVTAAMVAGLLSLLAIAVFHYFKLPDLPEVKVRGVHLPTILALGGAIAGWIVALVARQAARVSARVRGEAARRRITDAAQRVADDLVVTPVNAELERMRTLRSTIGRLATG